MSRFPEFTAEENLARVLIDRRTQYLIVEGPTDMPIYTEAIGLLKDKHNLISIPITVFGGGKDNILSWVDSVSPSNAAVILDMDFDDPETELNTEIVTSLRRYSIENYFFDEDVIAPLISQVLARGINDVKPTLSMDDLREHWLAELSDLVPVLYYYQKIFSGDRKNWNNAFINLADGDWHLCPIRIQGLKEGILTEMGVSYDVCSTSFNDKFGLGINPCINFPGKILLTSFFRYLRTLCNDEKAKSFNIVTNTKVLIAILASRLVNNSELEGILLNAVN